MESTHRKSKIEKIRNWYITYEHSISLCMLVLGFILDNLLLGQVDELKDILVLTTYISLGGLCIVLLSMNEKDDDGTVKNTSRHFWLTLSLQFIFGALFSAFVVFYVRTATIYNSWPFLLLLFLYFLGNEFLKHYYAALSFRLSMYFFALLAYFIIIVPTFTKSIGDLTFVLSTVIAVLVFSLFFWILSLYKKKVIVKNRKVRIIYYLVMLATINILYFTNLIPPLPLILRDVGVYHHMQPTGHGGYTVNEEKPLNWIESFWKTPVFHRYNSEPVYVYSAVYSPIDLNINIIHNWQYYDVANKKWITTGNVIVPIKGGREEGYRLYSLRNNITPGLWRVNVLAEGNRLVGRIKFEVVDATENPTLITLSK